MNPIEQKLKNNLIDTPEAAAPKDVQVQSDVYRIRTLELEVLNLKLINVKLALQHYGLRTENLKKEEVNLSGQIKQKTEELKELRDKESRVDG